MALLVAGCGSSLSSGKTPEREAGPECTPSGASCAATGCCILPYDSCVPQGDDQLCVHPIPPPNDGGFACLGGLTSDLSGVALIFDAAPCSYSQAELAAGIEIPYHEEIDSPLAGVHPVDADGGDVCAQPDAAGLIVNYDIAGGGQSYCLCSAVFCETSFTTAPAVGNYPQQIPWDGRNWTGPSNAPNPEGAAFPVGTYTVTLTAKGSIDGVRNGPGPANFTVTAARTITITP